MSARKISHRGQRLVLFVMAAASIWFFFEIWQNVSVLSTRTIPGVGYAADLLDNAADFELSRVLGSTNVYTHQVFVRGLDRYDETIAVEQDRANLEDVRSAYAAYLAAPGSTNWQRLRMELRELHAFRLQRAKTFANDSRDSFTSALGINVAGLVLFVISFFVFSLGFAIRNHVEDRPDNF